MVIRSIAKCVALGTAILGLVSGTEANPITGGISLSGNVTYPAADIDMASVFEGFSGVTVASASGSYAAAGVTAGTSISMSAFSFNPFPVEGLVPLWQTISGPYASFDLKSLTKVVQGDGFLTLAGLGTLHLAGFEDTAGYWRFSSQQGDTTFSFSSSNGNVPEAGVTAAMFASALAGLVFVRKKLA
jgi:hypothetical protein